MELKKKSLCFWTDKITPALQASESHGLLIIQYNRNETEKGTSIDSRMIVCGAMPEEEIFRKLIVKATLLNTLEILETGEHTKLAEVNINDVGH